MTRTRSNAEVELSKGLDTASNRRRNCHGSLKIGKASLTKKLLQSSIVEQREACLARFNDKYSKDKAKDIQIEATLSLIKRKTTFLLAGTGFGKSRIAELFFQMFPKVNQPVIMVLNPLDALGNNQVRRALIHLGCEPGTDLIILIL